MNPELRHTLNTFSRNLESANEAAQENIYTFTQLYVDPCLTGFKSCITDFTTSCLPNRNEQSRRSRGRRAELNFDFYDDWDDGEDAGWGNDELDSLLAGRGGHNDQPRRQRRMSYGSRNRRKGPNLPSDAQDDPTAIPSSSYLGFLERLPFKIGTKTLYYKPSAADLQVNPGGLRMRDAEEEPLIGSNDETEAQGAGPFLGRQRSGTASSRSTTNSLSSRGDLIPSDMEEDDAVALDDEFAATLTRRTTNTGASEDNSSSGNPGSTRKPHTSRASTARTTSSRSTRNGSKTSLQASSNNSEAVSPSAREDLEPPSVLDLAREEEIVSRKEEVEIEQKREAAQRLAAARVLPANDIEIKPDSVAATVTLPVLVTEIVPADATEREAGIQGDSQAQESSTADPPDNPPP